MMRIFIFLAGLALCGCASQATEPAVEEFDIQVFYEDPKIDYQSLGRVDTTSRGKTAMDVLNRTLGRAAQLGANGVIVHSILNKGTVAGGADAFGTGGGGGFSVFQIQATAIRYVN